MPDVFGCFSDAMLSECRADVLSLLPHCGYLCMVLPLVVYRIVVNKSKVSLVTRYPVHTARWLLSLSLIVAQLLVLFEGFIISKWLPWGSHLASSLALFTSLVTIACYDASEIIDFYEYVYASLPYWLTVVALKCSKIAALVLVLKSPQNAIRVQLSVIELSLQLGLVVCDVVLIWKLRHRRCCGVPQVRKPASSVTDDARALYNVDEANFVSRMTWLWVTPLLKHGYQAQIQMSDLRQIPKDIETLHNFEEFSRIYNDEQERTSGDPSLWRCYFRAYWRNMTISALYKVMSNIAMCTAPLMLEYIILYVMKTVDDNENEALLPTDNATNITIIVPKDPYYGSASEFFADGYVLSLLLFLLMMLQAVLFQNYMFIGVREGIRAKAAVQSMLYHKTIRLSTCSFQGGGLNQGQVLNHMSVDSFHILMLFYMGHLSWALILEVLTVYLLLYIQLGYSVLVSAVIIIVLMPTQYFVGVLLAKVQKKVIVQSDERLKKCNELFQSIKLLKLYAWERWFCDQVETVRRKELKLLFKAALLRVISISICDGAPLLAIFISFSIYPVIEKAPLHPAKVFSSLALFMRLAVPLYLVTLMVNTISHAYISTQRIRKFLSTPELGYCKRSDGSEIEQKLMSKFENESHLNGDVHSVPDVLILSKSNTATNSDTYKAKCNGKENEAVPLITVNKCDDIDQNADSQSHSEHANDEGDNSDSIKDSGDNVSIATDATDVTESDIEIIDGQFSWGFDDHDVSLRDINISIPSGKLTIVVGSVGSGKSSLLQALLGEMTVISGKVNINCERSMAYAAQKAWLRNATLRDNITFGRGYNEIRYNEIIEACALKDDIGSLVGGDLTEIGEKGINLSGGQKQRINIARALYNGAEIVLLDDPLSALDVHVGAHIFEHAIVGTLLKQGCTVVLVTHKLQYLPTAYKIIVMDAGHVMLQGSYEEIKQLDTTLMQTWAEHEDTDSENGDLHDTKRDKDKRPIYHHSQSVELPGSPMFELRSALSCNALRPGASCISLYIDDDDDITCDNRTRTNSHSKHDVKRKSCDKVDEADDVGKLIVEEERESGSVKLAVYLTYAKSATYIMAFLAVFGYCVRQALRMGTDYWLALWSEASVYAQSMTRGSTNTTYDDFINVSYYLHGYSIFCGVSMVIGSGAILFLEIMCIRAAQNLHHNMLRRLIQAPMRFFDTTPIGRILNRIAGDTNIIDEKMPVIIDSALFCVLFCLASIIMNAILTPFFIIGTVPMLILYVVVQRFYIASSRELQRLDNVSKSPIMAHFSETLGGLTTIRAYRVQDQFEQEHWNNIDTNSTSLLYLHTANAWVGTLLDFLGAFVVLVSCLCSVTSGIHGYASASVVGLAIAYAVMICGFLNWMMRCLSEAEMYFNSVERVAHYSNIDIEPYPRTLNKGEISSWPSEGAIEFCDVSLRYDSTLDPVIKGLSLTIKPGQKVGICGRTGSGKSSLTLGLFRLLDISSGRILIDNVDIQTLPLTQLRTQLAIIPQDPVLFEGTIRMNLDPRESFTDAEIWQALETAQLKSLIQQLPQKLDTAVSEGGENFSVGQRQLFCIARAFLRHSKILIMDEATGSIDITTDTAIQKVIEEAFGGRTVITIAHRVSTIRNADVIVVLSDGKIIEQGSPDVLMQQGKSVFKDMILSQ